MIPINVYAQSIVIPEQNYTNIQPPLKQIKSVIDAYHIQCRYGLDLILKYKDLSPACVSPATAEKLIQRGWSTPQIIKDQNEKTTKPFPPTIVYGRNFFTNSTSK